MFYLNAVKYTSLGNAGYLRTQHCLFHLLHDLNSTKIAYHAGDLTM